MAIPGLREWTQNEKLIRFIEEASALCRPEKVHLCDGSLEEYQRLTRLLVDKKIFVPLNPEKWPNSFWSHSSLGDVARVEESTFICSKSKDDAGPTNNWSDPEKMLALLKERFNGAMQGRTMYVIPYCMGPIGSALSQIGIEITDSPYVVCNMRIMTRIGNAVIRALGNNGFVPGMHSVGAPLKPGQQDMAWPCNEEKYIVHFPETRSIWSYGSGYGGNALLGKKCHALRIASVAARDQGWFAEHMALLSVTYRGKTIYIAAAFPSACGKTNFAMMKSSLPDVEVKCLGDDIAWMHFDADGKLYAINPEAGFFGVAPGTSEQSNPYAMLTLRKGSTIFTNVARTEDGDIWWEGMTKTPPDHLIDWMGTPWTSGQTASHPNGRFTTPAAQCPVIDPAWEDPKGVPISAIIFGGRRSSIVPLVREAFSWEHGVFFGASLSSEMTAAAKGTVGKLRHDPFAMLPFCGYNMGDYFGHWLKMGQGEGKQLPKIFHVNWFRKDDSGKFLWPGFGDNSRILKWMFERIDGAANGVATPIGYVPARLDLAGLTLPPDALQKLLHVEEGDWRQEAAGLEEYFKMFGEKLPQGIRDELKGLKDRLQ